MKRTMMVMALSLFVAMACLAEPSDSDAAWKSYRSKLHQYCGAKHLEMLPPADLLDVVDSFSASLTPDQQRLAKISTERACTGGEGGAGCRNAGFLEAAARAGYLDRFAAQVCGLPQHCNKQSVCIETGDTK